MYSLTFKMALSATLALVIGNVMGVQFATVAAVISILSIQNTRKDSFRIGVKRIIACTIAIFLGCILFKLIGQSPISFFIYLIAFIPITSKLKIEVGMVPAVVLATHLLIAEDISLYWILNELYIMIIGIGVASIANLFMPSLEGELRDKKRKVEEYYKVLFIKMAKSLITTTVEIDEEKFMIDIENELFTAKDLTYKIVNNKFLKADSYYSDYINMRINQFYLIKRMRNHFSRLYMSLEQTKIMSEFIEEIGENIKEENDCSELIGKANSLRENFKRMKLPESREEFENRAQLLQFLNDLEEFLYLKRQIIR